MKSLTVGGATIDTIAIIASDRIERMSMLNADSAFLLLKEGSKTEATEVSTHTGGGAVNTAVSMARLGLDTSALVKLGKDARAEMVLARLMAEGISTRWAVRDGRAPTGASVMVSSHERNAAVFTFRGANTLLKAEDLKDEAFAVDLVHVASLSNESADLFPDIIGKAKAAGAFVTANPGPRQLAARGRAFEACVGKIDILSINRSEAEVMLPSLIARFGEGGPAIEGTSLPRLAERGLNGGGFHMTLRAFVTAVSSLGPRYLLLTDGTEGAYVSSKDDLMFCPPLKVQVAGTAGAGDAFTSTFGTFIASGSKPDMAVRAATVNAASVVSYIDTQTGLLPRAEVEKRVAARAAEMPVQRWALGDSRARSEKKSA
ncbi:MAG: carbohydrate kinase family protein [Rhizobiales bacterium]|nr:carbohydrate kinase family protein [Hyphomicrobiales bacterium]